jgi:hypothetical protein
MIYSRASNHGSPLRPRGGVGAFGGHQFGAGGGGDYGQYRGGGGGNDSLESFMKTH